MEQHRHCVHRWITCSCNTHRKCFGSAGMGVPLLEVIPANVGDWQARRSIELSHASREDAQALNSPILIAALIQHVEAQADAEKGASLLHRGFLLLDLPA